MGDIYFHESSKHIQSYNVIHDDDILIKTIKTLKIHNPKPDTFDPVESR